MPGTSFGYADSGRPSLGARSSQQQQQQQLSATEVSTGEPRKLSFGVPYRSGGPALAGLPLREGVGGSLEFWADLEHGRRRSRVRRPAHERTGFCQQRRRHRPLIESKFEDQI